MPQPQPSTSISSLWTSFCDSPFSSPILMNMSVAIAELLTVAVRWRMVGPGTAQSGPPRHPGKSPPVPTATLQHEPPSHYSPPPKPKRPAVGSAFDVESHFAFGLPSRGYGLHGRGSSPRRVSDLYNERDRSPGAQTGRGGASGLAGGRAARAALSAASAEQAFILGDRRSEIPGHARWLR